MAVFLSDEQTDEVVDLEDLVAVAQHVVLQERIPADMEVALLLVDLATMTGLNAQHMGQDGATDVLAFPIDEPGESTPDAPALLGDVVLCPAYARDQAARLGRGLQDELRMLTVHGMLHLLGMDHDSPERERVMFTRTDELLAGLGPTGSS